MSSFYPIELDLQGRHVLIVGGGRVAARKVEGLLAAGAKVRVVSPAFIEDLAGNEAIERVGEPYDPRLLAGADFVFACTDDPEVNRRVASDARTAGRWCNVADDAAAGDFLLPAVLRQGELTVAVGTGGASPHLAAKLRDRLESQLEPTWGILVSLLRQARARVMERVADAALRRDLFAELCADCSVKLLQTRGQAAWWQWFERLVTHRLEHASTPQKDASDPPADPTP